MRERLTDINGNYDRFSGFVVEHAGKAMRWEVMDRRPEVPIDFVQFDTTDVDKKWQSPTSDSVARYLIELWAKLPPTRQRSKTAPPDVRLELNTRENVLAISDERDGLITVMPADRSDVTNAGVVVGVLLDQLESLEGRQKLIPAGRRTFPLDGNIINQL